MSKKQRQGFTLIEIMIVIAIIAILASAVLIGLGSTQKAGRDSRRISDLRQVQTALELYHNDKATYPIETTWAAMANDLMTDTNISVGTIPNDPNPGATYYYTNVAGGQDYVIGAQLETGSQVFNGYVVPTLPDGWPAGVTCTQAALQYCITL
jgi:prepilin-type N-terminal cleavage/methylation domain-containing protein